MMKTGDRIAYPSRATVNDAYQGVRRIYGTDPPRAVGTFLTALDAYCTRHGLDFAILAAHSSNETDYWRDDRFRARRDGFGIGKTGPGVEGAAFDSYDDAAFFAVFEYRVKLGHAPILNDWSRAAGIYREKVDRLSRIVSRPDWPKVERIEDLNRRFGDDDCVWFCDPNGPAAIVAKGNAIFPGLPDQQGGTMPGKTLFAFAKQLTTRDLGQLTDREAWITIHNNGNPSSDRFDEREFVNNGGGASGVLYHGAIDAGGVVQIARLDRRGVHAGNVDGNRTSIAFEMCEGSEPWDRVKEHTAQLLAEIVANSRGILDYGRYGPENFSLDRVREHRDWPGANPSCPAKLIATDGGVEKVVARARAIVKAIGAGGGQPEPPATDYPDGLDEKLATAWFGSIARPFKAAFNPDGPVSQLWLAYGRETGQWPKLVRGEKYGTRRYYVFDSGLVIWVPKDGAAPRILKAA
jgi:hypothetical protein